MSSNGFTLVEMAIVLVIVALLMAGLLPTISGQIEQRQNNETRKQLDEIQQALIGYAITHGRLPCPASDLTSGIEDPPTGGACNHFNDGFVPAATLGIASVVDSKGNKGFAVDSWGNRIRYTVTSWSSVVPSVPNVFTTANGMSMVGIANLSPDLQVCSSSTTGGFSPTSCGPNNALTSPGVPVVIVSTGKNGGTGMAGAGIDEQANIDNNLTFVSHDFTPTFDDLVVWVSPNILINRMVAAGKLP